MKYWNTENEAFYILFPKGGYHRKGWVKWKERLKTAWHKKVIGGRMFRGISQATVTFAQIVTQQYLHRFNLSDPFVFMACGDTLLGGAYFNLSKKT